MLNVVNIHGSLHTSFILFLYYISQYMVLKSFKIYFI